LTNPEGWAKIPSATSFGYQPWFAIDVAGGSMQRVNMYDFYQLGAAIQPLESIAAESKLDDTWWHLLEARRLLSVLVNSRILRVAYARPAALELTSVLTEVLKPIFDHKEGESPDWTKEIGHSDAYRIKNTREVFQHNLAAELQQHDTYAVSQKGIYSTGELIERTENLFSEEVKALMPSEAIADIKAAGQCIAFDVPTAAGFHILRCIETMIVRYMKVVGAKLEKDSQRNWGAYISKLKAAGADEKVVATLDQIRDLHRNPTLHPEVFLTQDEALALLGVAQSVILGIVADIKRRETGAQLELGKLVEELTPDGGQERA
jgi:hypothetical protein